MNGIKEHYKAHESIHSAIEHFVAHNAKDKHYFIKAYIK